MSTITLSSLSFFLSSFENIGCKVTNSQLQIQRLVVKGSLELSSSVCVCLFNAVCVCACALFSIRILFLQDAVKMESEPPLPLPPAAARRLFDLDCADGSRPTGCQVEDRVDMLSGFGGEYIVVI